LRFLFIFNPAAGRGRARRDLPRLRAALEKAGVSGDWKETRAPDHGIALAAESVREGVDVVVAVGGDGTENEVVGGLMSIPSEKRPAFGLLPAGTGNDYAHLLGLSPRDPEGAARVLARGATRMLDVGDVNGRFFANGVGVGFDGSVAENAATMTWMKGFPAYLVAVFITLAHWRNFGLTARVDGETLEGRTLLAAIGIGPRSGGGFWLTPDARPDDGLFDFCRLGDFGKLEALRHLPKALTGKHVHLEKTTMRRAKEIVLSADRPITAHVDGNLLRGVACEEPLVFRIHPGALRVIA
jgi:diacylglycerol kinase (ATP)